MPLLPMSSFFERISWGQRTLRRSTFWLFAAHIFPSTLWRIIPVSKAIWKGNDTTGSLGDETNHWTESWPSKGPKAFVTLPILPFLTEGLWNGPSFERILDTSFSIALKKWWKKGDVMYFCLESFLSMKLLQVASLTAFFGDVARGLLLARENWKLVPSKFHWSDHLLKHHFFTWRVILERKKRPIPNQKPLVKSAGFLSIAALFFSPNGAGAAVWQRKCKHAFVKSAAMG